MTQNYYIPVKQSVDAWREMRGSSAVLFGRCCDYRVNAFFSILWVFMHLHLKKTKRNFKSQFRPENEIEKTGRISHSNNIQTFLFSIRLYRKNTSNKTKSKCTKALMLNKARGEGDGTSGTSVDVPGIAP